MDAPSSECCEAGKVMRCWKREVFQPHNLLCCLVSWLQGLCFNYQSCSSVWYNWSVSQKGVFCYLFLATKCFLHQNIWVRIFAWVYILLHSLKLSPLVIVLLFHKARKMCLEPLISYRDAHCSAVLIILLLTWLPDHRKVWFIFFSTQSQP